MAEATVQQQNTFVLDGTRYEIDTMPEKGKRVLQLISEIRTKTELEIQTSELAIDRLTAELKSMSEEFTAVEEAVETEGE